MQERTGADSTNPSIRHEVGDHADDQLHQDTIAAHDEPTMSRFLHVLRAGPMADLPSGAVSHDDIDERAKTYPFGHEPEPQPRSEQYSIDVD